MHHAVFWTLLALGLPQVAAAGGAIGAGPPPILPGGSPAIERADAPAITAAPGLDLRIDPAQLGAAQYEPFGVPALESEWADQEAELDAADRGLSFGLEVKPRSRLGALARQSEPGDSGLGVQLEKLIEQPVLGVRGSYRF
jgi:hypothetical protein